MPAPAGQKDGGRAAVGLGEVPASASAQTVRRTFERLYEAASRPSPCCLRIFVVAAAGSGVRRTSRKWMKFIRFRDGANRHRPRFGWIRATALGWEGRRTRRIERRLGAPRARRPAAVTLLAQGLPGPPTPTATGPSANLLIREDFSRLVLRIPSPGALHAP